MTKDEKIKSLFDAMNERPIAFHRVYAQITGSVTAGLLLSQLMYWSKAMNDKEFYKTDKELCDELCFGKYELRGAKKKIEPFVKITRKGTPAKTWYKVNKASVLRVITSCGKTRQLVVGKPDNKLLENQTTYYTENNTENKTDIFAAANAARDNFLKSLDTIGKKDSSLNKKKQPTGKKITPPKPPSKIPESFTEKINGLQITKEEDVPYQDVTEVISYFLPILPGQFVTRSPFLQKPTQGIVRKALTMATKESLKELIDKYHSKQTDTYCPTITTVYTFFSKIDQIKAFLNKATSGLHAHRPINSAETKALNKAQLEKNREERRIRSEKLSGMSWEDYKIFEKKEKEEEKEAREKAKEEAKLN